MTLNQLEYFCAVCRYRSIAKASEALFVSSPSISVAIRELEKEFGISLLTHTKNRIFLTEEGEAFFKKAELILRQSEDLHTEFSGIRQNTRPLKIGIPPLLSTVYFPRMIESFHKVSETPVCLFEYGSNRAQEMVNSGELDIALVNMDFYNIDQFENHVLMEDSYIYCVSKNHPLADANGVTLEELAGENLIFYNTDSVQNMTFRARFRALGIQPRILMHGSQLYTTLSFVREGNCGALLFSTIEVDPDEFRKIPIVPKFSEKIGIIWKKGTYIPLRTSRFIEFAKGFKIEP